MTGERAASAIAFIRGMAEFAEELAQQDIVVASLSCDWRESGSWMLFLENGRVADEARSSDRSFAVQLIWEGRDGILAVDISPLRPHSSPHEFGDQIRQAVSKTGDPIAAARDILGLGRNADGFLSRLRLKFRSREQRLRNILRRTGETTSKSGADALALTRIVYAFAKELAERDLVVFSMKSYWSAFGNWMLVLEDPRAAGDPEAPTVQVSWDRKGGIVSIDLIRYGKDGRRIERVNATERKVADEKDPVDVARELLGQISI